jgi:hypothetical protein
MFRYGATALILAFTLPAGAQVAYEAQIRATIRSTLYILWEDRQCVGSNGLDPYGVVRALEAEGIGVLKPPAPVEGIPICEVCYPACSIHLEYEIGVSPADRLRVFGNRSHAEAALRKELPDTSLAAYQCELVTDQIGLPLESLERLAADVFSTQEK